MIIRDEVESISRFLGETSGIDEFLLGNESIDCLSDVRLNGVCDDGDDTVAVWD